MPAQMARKTHPLAHLPANASVGHFRNLNLYRVTVRDQKGKIAARETRAASLVLSVQDLDEKSEIVKVEWIHPSTGKCLEGYTTSRIAKGQQTITGATGPRVGCC
jgi:hypothetical protein